MYVFFVCTYIIYCVLWVVLTNKRIKLARDLIDTLAAENDLLVAQNNALKDIIKKYGIN